MTKILLVEDDKSLREIYGVRLLAEGYDIISAGDGEEALAMSIKERPSLIVSDVMMPKISGFDMLDILRSTTETKDIKVIMMTALSSEDQRKRGEQLGADRYLVKSQVGIEDVVRTVHEVLGDAPTSTAASPFTTTTQPTQAAQPSTPPVANPTPHNTAPAPSPTPTPSANPAAIPPRPTSQSPSPAPSAPTASALPQPTAPFSTPRPNAGVGRVIEPVNNPADVSSAQGSFASRLEQELQGATQPSSSAPQPTAPNPQPAAPNVGPAPSMTPPAPLQTNPISTPPSVPSNPQSTPSPVQQPSIPNPTPPLPPPTPNAGQPS